MLLNASLGIIGGADGPTAIFVSGSVWPLVAVAAAGIAAICAIVYAVRSRAKR